MPNFFTLYGEQLIANGYPILPIEPGSKRPAVYQRGKWIPYKGWPKHAARATTQHELSLWQQWPDGGIGLACGTIVGVDIDIVDDATMADEVQQIAFDVLGQTEVIRIGQHPKRMLIYRTDEPFQSLKQHPVEILGSGSQFVIYAVHAKTGEPYKWPFKALHELPLIQLPIINKNAAERFLGSLGGVFKHDLNFTQEKITNELEGNPFAIAEALQWIPSDDYHDWVRIGMAIKGALGQDAHSLFMQWSAKSEKYDERAADKTWNSMKPTQIGAGTIYRLAMENGWQPADDVILNPSNVVAGEHPAEAFLQRIQQPGQEPSQPEKPHLTLDEPFDPLAVDGVLKELLDYMLVTAIRPQPLLYLGNALCALGVLMGHMFRTESNMRTNLYIVGLADSGSGKNHSREVINDVFIRAGLKHFLGGNRIASGAGLLSALKRCNGTMLLQQDEFGMFMQAVANRARSPKHITDILDLMTELYTSASTMYFGTEYGKIIGIGGKDADKKNLRDDISQPCLCIYGTTTPLMFWSALKSGNVGDGSLARFIILQTENNYPDVQDRVIQDPPESLIDSIIKFSQSGSCGDGNLQGSQRPTAIDGSIAIAPAIIPLDGNARVMLRALSCEVNELLKQNQSTVYSSLLARVVENVYKIAAVRAASTYPESPVIRDWHMAWAIGLIKQSTNALIDNLNIYVADNETEQKSKRVLNIIRQAGERGIGGNDLCQASRFLNRRERADLLSDLVESGDVVFTEIKASTRPVKRYFLNKCR